MNALDSLREAIRLSPDNIPLRRHFAEQLLAAGHVEQAENEFRKALAEAPGSEDLKIGLARVFYQQGKDSAALVIVEELLKHIDPSAQAYLLGSRLMLRTGDIPKAVAQYKAAVDADPDVADTSLAARLGINAPPESAVLDGRVRETYEDTDSESRTPIERPKLTFAQVGGMEQLKEEIRLKILYPLQHPELYAAYGKTIGGGILMYGPPGCGKTYLARATAGELRASFMSIGINDVLEMWIGSSERNLHELFEQARNRTPCVLFFDEVDALGARRSDLQHSTARQLINQFLAEMDGVQSSNEGVLILAATNAPWHLDPAFRRPGRFDRILFVPPPDQPARAEILKDFCLNKPQKDIDFEHLSKKAPEFSGADLKAVLDVAIEQKLKQALKEGIPKPLTTADLLNAIKDLRPTTKEWFSTARNYALYSNQGGTYDDILKYMKM